MGNIAEENVSALCGDYVKLEEGTSDCSRESAGVAGDDDVGGDSCWWSLWRWAKRGLIVLFVGLLVAVLVKWVGPFVMDKQLIPIIIWERKTFSKPMVALLVFGCLAILPSFLLPSGPFMWIGGMTFGYGYGFLIIIAGVAVGVSLPYFIGSLFCDKIHRCLERYSKNASAIKIAGEGDWFNQFRAVALIRVSPFPNIAYNYLAVATDVKYAPYLFGSLTGMIPEIFICIYTGILIKSLAETSRDHQSLSPGQTTMNIAGFCISVTAAVMITVYAKRQLKELQVQEEKQQQLQQQQQHLLNEDDDSNRGV